jgi:SAM-dependent methyltransferase
VKRHLLHLLERTRLLRPAYRGYERLQALRDRSDGDEPGVPPAQLRVRVAGTADLAWFLEGGRLAAETVRDTAVRHGLPLEGLDGVLDFGCGCGRVVRHLRGIDLAGSDADAPAIAWCRRNLPYARFETNGRVPPLAWEDGTFDLAYAFSVLTHLTEELQARWLVDLARVLRPGGLLLVSTHGDRYRERLSGDERTRFDAGEIVVRWEQAEGTNLCAAYHPRRSVERLAPAFAFVETVAEGARGNPHQDLHVLRKP